MVSSDRCVVAVVGTTADVPLPAAPEGCELRFITSREQLASDAADAEVVFAWEPRLDWIETCWGWSPWLRWIAAATAGVDYLMFPALIDSDVVVTNSAGVFDGAMAEYALALVSAVCADLPATIRLQGRRQWLHRETRRLAGSEILVLGAGGIGRAITRLLTSAGANVRCLARTPRTDPEIGPIAGMASLTGLLPAADFVVLALPFTPATAGIIGAPELSLLGRDAWIVNLGRGGLIDEPALTAALAGETIGGAALDVFSTEILREHFVTDETFALALAEFGERGLVDVIGSLGNFSMLAMLLNTFQVDLQAAEPPFPDVRGYAKAAASLGG